MTDSCLATAAFCICSALIAVLLRQYSREQSVLAELAACAGILTASLMFISPLLTSIRDLFSCAGISDSYLTVIFKAAAVSVITEITCELCRDCGEHSIAAAAEIWGRGMLILLAMPLVRAMIERITDIL